MAAGSARSAPPRTRILHLTERTLRVMAFLRPGRLLVSATQAAISRIRAAWLARKRRIALKGLSPHLLKDIGQEAYYERRELDHDQIANSMDHYRW